MSIFECLRRVSDNLPIFSFNIKTKPLNLIIKAQRNPLEIIIRHKAVNPACFHPFWHRAAETSPAKAQRDSQGTPAIFQLLEKPLK